MWLEMSKNASDLRRDQNGAGLFEDGGVVLPLSCAEAVQEVFGAHEKSRHVPVIQEGARGAAGRDLEGGKKLIHHCFLI